MTNIRLIHIVTQLSSSLSSINFLELLLDRLISNRSLAHIASFNRLLTLQPFWLSKAANKNVLVLILFTLSINFGCSLLQKGVRKNVIVVIHIHHLILVLWFLKYDWKGASHVYVRLVSFVVNFLQLFKSIFLVFVWLFDVLQVLVILLPAQVHFPLVSLASFQTFFLILLKLLLFFLLFVNLLFSFLDNSLTMKLSL